MLYPFLILALLGFLARFAVELNAARLHRMPSYLVNKGLPEYDETNLDRCKIIAALIVVGFMGWVLH